MTEPAGEKVAVVVPVMAEQGEVAGQEEVGEQVVLVQEVEIQQEVEVHQEVEVEQEVEQRLVIEEFYEVLQRLVSGDDQERQAALGYLRELVDMDVAIVVIFARDGIMEQLARHAALCRVQEVAAAVTLLLERLPQGEAEALEARLGPHLSAHFEPPARLLLPAAAQLCQLYRQHPGLLPREVVHIATLAVRIMATLALMPQLNPQLPLHQAQLEEVAAVLPILWDKHTDVLAAVMRELKAEMLYGMSAHWSLAAVVVLLPWDKAHELVQEAPRLALAALMAWLTRWRGERLARLFLYLLDTGLRAGVRGGAPRAWVGHLTSLTRDGEMERLVSYLLEPDYQAQLELVVFRLIYGAQNSQRTFKLLVPAVTLVLQTLAEEQDLDLLGRVQEAATFHRLLHSLAYPADLTSLLPTETPTTARCTSPPSPPCAGGRSSPAWPGSSTGRRRSASSTSAILATSTPSCRCAGG